MIAIHPQYLNLASLFNGRLFQIPDYQRAYSWTSKQRADLFGDIQHAFQKGSDAGHFMAAIVCLRRKKVNIYTNEFQTLDVVDGQQRLTTIVLLLKTIALKAVDADKKQKKLVEELDDLLVKPGSNELLLLQTNHDSSHYFSNYLIRGESAPSDEAKTIADRELLGAIEDCSDFVDSWTASGNALTELVALLKNRLFLLLHEIEDEEAVYTVFEVLNSRGLEVSWFDRLKSILMGAAFELAGSANSSSIRELHSVWRDIYAIIGLRQGMSTESLRFAATLRNASAPSRPLSESAAVDLLRSEATSIKSIKTLAQWLLKVTKACDEVASSSRTNAVTRIVQARLLATAIYLRSDLSSQERAELLAIWERVTFRIYGMFGNDSRKRVGEFVRLAWSVVNEKLSAPKIKAGIRSIGKDFPIEDAVWQLENTNCYEGWEDELRYFLFRYEEHLAKKAGQKFSNEQWEKIWLVSPSKSIEHIMPQSKAAVKQKHRLGNLVLLPPNLNSKLQDLDPKNKADDYHNTGLLQAIEVAAKVKKANRWTKDAISQREAALLKWAKSEWSD
ncbi:MAG: DUF262 domain-containing protein [Pseudomonadota bacterium]